VNCKWMFVPKSVGGWGLKDLVSFGHALAEKSLWVFMTSHCMWRCFLISEYIEPRSILE
jgi:hypothetical protein